MKILDLTQGIYEGIKNVYPGDELPKIEKVGTEKYVNYRVTIGMHTGTHIDAPAHMLSEGKSLYQMPIDSFCGEGCLVNMTDGLEVVSRDKIVLIHTGCSDFYGEDRYFTEYPAISEYWAQIFVKNGVKMVGIDAPSPDYYPFNVHKLLFKNNILIIENLVNLNLLVGVKNFYVYALPIKINTDSAIARVIAVY